MPLGYTNYSNEPESLDILTPDILKLGRNNDRSPVGPLSVSGKCKRFLHENERIFNSWFYQWLISYVPTLLKQQKWFQDDHKISVGDVVIFMKKEGELNVTYQYGMVEAVQPSKDHKIRTVIVRYWNHGENVNRTTKRAVRELVLIHHIDELDIISELGAIASAVDAKKRLQINPTGWFLTSAARQCYLVEPNIKFSLYIQKSNNQHIQWIRDMRSSSDQLWWGSISWGW